MPELLSYSARVRTCTARRARRRTPIADLTAGDAAPGRPTLALERSFSEKTEGEQHRAAVDMKTRKLALLVSLAVGAFGTHAPAAYSESTIARSVVLAVPKDEVPATAEERVDVRSLHRASALLLQMTLRQRRNSPDWLMHEAGSKPLVVTRRLDPQSRYLALQVDQLDGTDMLIVRQAFETVGKLQLYAGAGLGRAKYLDDDVLAKPLPRRRARHELAPAAEIGAQAQLGTQLALDASVRWLDLSRDVTLLKTDYGPMDASEVMLGVTVGYRFR
jgi:hypothetical protein